MLPGMLLWQKHADTSHPHNDRRGEDSMRMRIASCQSVSTSYKYIPIASDASGPSRASRMSLVVIRSSSGAAAAVTAATQPPGGTGGGCMLSCCVNSANGAFHIWSQE